MSVAGIDVFGSATVRTIAAIVFVLVGLLIGGKIFFGIASNMEAAFPEPSNSSALYTPYQNFVKAIGDALNLANPLLLLGIGVIAMFLVGILIRVIT